MQSWNGEHKHVEWPQGLYNEEQELEGFKMDIITGHMDGGL